MNWKKNVAAVMGIILFSSIIACHGWAELQDGSKILKVKGLYLGMNIDDAYKVLSDKLVQGIEILQEAPGSPRAIYYLYEGMPIPIVTSDIKNRVTTMLLPEDIVDKLFNTTGLPAEDFAKKFVESYHISKMEPFSEMMNNSLVTGWRFISPEGFSLIITTQKTILLKEIAKSSETKFD